MTAILCCPWAIRAVVEHYFRAFLHGEQPKQMNSRRDNRDIVLSSDEAFVVFSSLEPGKNLGTKLELRALIRRDYNKRRTRWLAYFFVNSEWCRLLSSEEVEAIIEEVKEIDDEDYLNGKIV